MDKLKKLLESTLVKDFEIIKEETYLPKEDNDTEFKKNDLFRLKDDPSREFVLTSIKDDNYELRELTLDKKTKDIYNPYININYKQLSNWFDKIELFDGNGELDESVQYLVEGIEEIKKYFPNVPEEKFQQLVDLDPTYTGGNKLGKFGKWILTLYNKGQLKDEDFYKVTEYLITFKNNLQKIQNKDIMSYKTLPDLAKAIQGYENQEDVSNRQQVKNIKKDVKKVKETNEWLIISPKTEQSACYYGANTKWCTAGKNHNMFDYYNDQGPIYIFINKLNNKKYQFHAESFQFMNELDEPTAPAKVIKDKELLDFIEEKLFNYIHDDDYDCYEECPLYGVYPNDDYYAVTTDDIENFFSMFYGGEDSETLNIIEKWWYNEDIDEIIEIIRELSYYDKLDEKAKEIGFDSYEDILNSKYFEKDFKNKMKEIDEIIVSDLFDGSPINSYRIIVIEHSTDNENMFAYLSMDNQVQNYDDFLVEWFMTSNKNVYQDVLSYVLENTDTSNISSEIKESLFNLVNDIKNNPDQLSFDFNESVIKNPKNIMVESYLKSSPLRFAFNPMSNDFIITDISHNPIPLNESVEKYITGILSPNLVEITSNIADDYNDSKEIVENLLGKRFKEIFKNHYEIIL